MVLYFVSRLRGFRRGGNNPASSQKHPACGTYTVCDKIVGGKETCPHQYPWHVGIVPKHNKGPNGWRLPFCGGTLISDRHVLSAAHCFKHNKVASTRQVVVAEHNIKSHKDGTYMDLNAITLHPNYKRDRSDYDFAMLTLKTPVDYSLHNGDVKK